jgi:hypothetical protein
MGLFGSKTPDDRFPLVSTISAYPTIGTAILKVHNNLIVFSPSYLLGKHGAASTQVASKFYDLNSGMKLLQVLSLYITPGILKGDRVEIKEADTGMIVGEDTLVEVPEKLAIVLPKEDVRGNMINVVYTKKELIPQTKFINIILVTFNPQYGDGIDQLFLAKYPGVGFQSFDHVYSVVTMFPGKFAPAMTDKGFWDRHALLKDIALLPK